MSVNLYNSEGYLDPTAYEALSRIEQEAKRTAYKPLVFICSPFAGDMVRNAERARAYCPFCGIKELYPDCAAPSVSSIHGGGRPGPAGAWHLFRAGLTE